MDEVITFVVGYGTIGGLLVRWFSPDRFPKGIRGYGQAILSGWLGALFGWFLWTVWGLRRIFPPTVSPFVAVVIAIVVAVFGTYIMMKEL